MIIKALRKTVLGLSAVLVLTACDNAVEAPPETKPAPAPVMTDKTNTLAAMTNENSDPRCAEFEDLIKAVRGPGLAVMVTDSQSVVLHCVYGRRHIDRPDPITQQDHWHLGSNTKAITAVLAARLEQEGLIEWTDTLEGSIDDLPEDYPYNLVGYADLFTHMSGLPGNLMGGYNLQFLGTDAERDGRSDRRKYVDILAEIPSEGDGFVYSNVGYTVAGAMMEAKAGQSWEDLMTAYVFTPLGMDSAGFGPPGIEDITNGTVSQPRGHLGSSKLIAAKLELADNPPVIGPAGRVHVALEDYAKFLQMNLNALGGGSEDFLSAANTKRLFDASRNNYAMGWMKNGDMYGHEGSNTMWHVLTLLDPQSDRAAVVVTNSGDVQIQSPLFAKAALKAMTLPRDDQTKK